MRKQFMYSLPQTITSLHTHIDIASRHCMSTTHTNGKKISLWGTTLIQVPL